LLSLLALFLPLSAFHHLTHLPCWSLSGGFFEYLVKHRQESLGAEGWARRCCLR
jgi:hypothetical protein